MLALVLCGPAMAQETVQVSGTVTASVTGEKLWGASVRVRGATIQTVTDQQGRYSITAPSNGTLTFALIGYRGLEQAVGGRTTVDVVMEAAPTTLQEVVVTGYTSQRRADITGAVSSVNLDNANKQTSASVLQRLDGRVPGVVVEASGSPGSRSTVRIRGVSSFHDNDPLYIIDGTPVSGESYLNFLNPNDVGEIQVLKDASSASIYGSRASNGVIIIETKKGRPGGRQATLDVRSGVATPTRGYDDLVMQDALQYFEVVKRSYMNANQGRVDTLGNPIPYTLDSLPPELLAIYGDPRNPSVPKYVFVPAAAVVSVDSFGRPLLVNESMYSWPGPDNKGATLIMPGSAGTNWWKAVFGPAQFSDANLALSGGGSDNTYNVSFNYLKANGTAAYSQFQRGTLRVNTTFLVNKFTIGQNLAVSREQAYGGLDDGNLGENNIVGKNILMQPVVPVYDVGGHFASGKFGLGGNNTNPLGYAWMRRFDRNTNDRAIGNVFASVDALPAVTLRSRFSFNLRQGGFRGFTPITPENSEPGTVNGVNENNTRGTAWTFTNTVTYQRTTPRHNLALLLGQEASSSTSFYSEGSIAGLLNDEPSKRYIDDALGNPATKNVRSEGSLDRLLSFFGKADYNYAGKYYASVTLRRDGSSKFAVGNQWGTFPAFNVGWRASRESFFPQNGFISNAMVRFGWGMTGNQQIPGGRILPRFGGGRGDTFYDIGGTGTSVVAGFRQTALGNPALAWETNKSTNVGLDLEFLQGRGNLTLDVYERITGATDGHGLLFDPGPPGAAGAASPSILNVGKVSNKGFDFAISYNGTMGAGKVWSVAFNGSHYRNRILNIAKDLSQFDGGSTSRLGTAVSNQLGQPIGAFYGLQANGYFADSADALAHRTNGAGSCPARATGGACQDGAQPGRLRFVDVNGDSAITSADRTIIGSPHPDFTAGLDLGARWGAWDISASIFGSFGADIFDAQKNFYVFRDFSTNVLKDRLTDSFCLPADEGCTHPYDQNAKYPRLDQNDGESRKISSYYIESGTYVRLRNLQIGWTVPTNMIRWFPVARIYLQAENLFTITGYPGLDPALPPPVFTGASGDIRDQFRGVDQGAYPQSRTFTIGISTQF